MLPVWWWLKLVIGVVLAFMLLPVLGWLSGPLGRVLRFLLDPVVSIPSRQATSVGGGTVISTALDVRALAANYGGLTRTTLAPRRCSCGTTMAANCTR